MYKFLIKYASGLQEEVKCGLESVELFCNQHFGSTWGEAYENGATVDMVPAVAAEPVAEPVAEPLETSNFGIPTESVKVLVDTAAPAA